MALVEEQPEERPLNSRVEVGIGEDDVGAFPAEFEADPFEIAARRRLPEARDARAERFGVGRDARVASCSAACSGVGGGVTASSLTA